MEVGVGMAPGGISASETRPERKQGEGRMRLDWKFLKVWDIWKNWQMTQGRVRAAINYNNESSSSSYWFLVNLRGCSVWEADISEESTGRAFISLHVTLTPESWHQQPRHMLLVLQECHCKQHPRSKRVQQGPSTPLLHICVSWRINSAELKLSSRSFLLFQPKSILVKDGEALELPTLHPTFIDQQPTTT